MSIGLEMDAFYPATYSPASLQGCLVLGASAVAEMMSLGHARLTMCHIQFRYPPDRPLLALTAT